MLNNSNFKTGKYKQSCFETYFNTILNIRLTFKQKAIWELKILLYLCNGIQKRGHCPFFYCLQNRMINREYISSLCEDYLKGSENYLIDVRVSPANKIIVLIENDGNVAIRDCIALSKHIESSLDRDKEDFELEVSSPGIDQPFKNPRQFRKYLGRSVEVKLGSGEIKTGKLIEAEEETIVIEPEKIGKGPKRNNQNDKTTGSLRIPLKDIRETRLKIIF